jgi:hypothetical protein
MHTDRPSQHATLLCRLSSKHTEYISNGIGTLSVCLIKNHVMKTYGDVEVYRLHSPGHLTPRYIMERRRGTPRSRCEEENVLSLLEIEPRFSGLPAHILVTILTEMKSREVLTTILWSFWTWSLKKNTSFWDVTSCSQVQVRWRFGGTCRLHLRCRIYVKKAAIKEQTPWLSYCHDLGVTVDGVWIGYWIYWPLIHMTRKCRQLQRHR